MRIALEMEAHVPKSRGEPAGFDRSSPSHGKSEEEMQIEERCKTRIPGRPGEGAVRGVLSGAAQLESWCTVLHSPGSRCNQINGSPSRQDDTQSNAGRCETPLMRHH